MRRLRDYSLCLCLLLLWPLAVNADDSWRQIQTEARGQTVWFNAWGGDPAVNRYLAWVSEEVKRYYAIDLRIVPVADAADAVKRIQTEAQAGRRQGGSVDLLWINGENFRTLKQADLLLTGWAESLPNWRYVDQQKPVREDFSVATEGAESPWGSAQLTFIARRGQTPQPPTSPQALLAFARAHPGSVTYPRPPDFTGTALLEQLLIALTDQPAALRQPPQPATFAAVTAPLWRYLDALHPALWRAGKDFPASPARMDAMLNQGTLRLSLTFNPLHARQKAASGELPTDSYSSGFTAGTLGNVHFVTIPANARAVAGAKVVANFLLSLRRNYARPMPPSGAIRAYWIRSVCLTASARRWRQPCRRICRRCLPSLTRHGLTRWSRNGCAATVPTDPAGLGGDGGDLSAAAPRRRGTGGRCALPGPLAGAVRRPAAGPGAGRHPRLDAVVRRRRAADRPDHRRRPLAFGPLAAAGFPSAAAAGGAPSRPGDGGAAAVRRRGWLWQQLPFLTPPVDRYGIGLGLTMALKESAFVLWVIYGLLGEKRLADQATALKSLGYGRWQCLRWLVLPALLPALGMVLLATTAWSLSAVDVALVLGPGNPPTLAVLAWQWLSQGDELQQAKGALASLLLMASLGGLALVAWSGWRLQRQYQPDLHGVRHPHPHALPGRLLAALLPLSGLLGALLLAGLARSAPPQMDALGNSLGLALAACALGAAVCLLWLACGPARGDGWVWLPLVLPALPLADGQYRLALYAWLDGDWWTVLWGHLLWVVPWMLFILRPAWRQRDPRLTVVARTLGWGSTRIFWLLTLPSLTRPLLTALAVGFSVSIAQYLPTLWLGAGRIPTLTSQAVALSSGGEAQTLAAQALWQLLLPAVCFTLTALLAWLAGRYRRGLR